ncbi:GTPase Der [Acrasis kona]|uniref:GTPase Der n=1 Tax=Acrasis kona TaxID=1008807 RepID=A0AAW2YVL4_9EUKA
MLSVVKRISTLQKCSRVGVSLGLCTQTIRNKNTKVAFVRDNRVKSQKLQGGHSEPVLTVQKKSSLRVAIIGRPNVGKSTLFNVLAGGYHAIADKTSGVTRDCQEMDAELKLRYHGEHLVKKYDIYSDVIGNKIEFVVVDTPGADNIDKMILQTENSLQSVHLALLVTDYKSGSHDWDHRIAQYLIKRNIPTIHVLNKCDKVLSMDLSDEETFRRHIVNGMGKPIPISADHKLNIAELARVIHPYYSAYKLKSSMLERIEQKTNQKIESTTKKSNVNKSRRSQLLSKKSAKKGFEGDTMRLALIGRANVGKSTMLNKLIGEERCVVSNVPGTTRDTIEMTTTYAQNDKSYRILLADTAGIRNKKHIHDDRVQTLSHEDTMRTIKYANVVCLLVDAQEPLNSDDIDIARMIEHEGRAIVIAANKWDAVQDPYVIAQRIEETIHNALSQIKGLSVVVCSALTGKNLSMLIRKCVDCYSRWDTRIPTGKLNAFMEKYLTTQSLPAYFPKIQYVTQVDTRPPKFALFFKGRETELPSQFERQLLNAIREEFDLGGVPIRFIQKSRNLMANGGVKPVMKKPPMGRLQRKKRKLMREGKIKRRRPKTAPANKD